MKAVKILLLVAATLMRADFASAQTWTLTTAPTNFDWLSVASSADGTKLAAASGGFIPIYTSTNSGETWISNNSPRVFWISIASSADGNRLVAVTPNYDPYSITTGAIYASTNSGTDWTQTSAPLTNWYAVASSANGIKLSAVAGGSGASGPIYTSTNSGFTWAQADAPDAQWRCIASSADGTRLVAAAFAGPVYVSTNSGITWFQADAPTNVNWSAVAISADGSKLMAANGFTIINNPFSVIEGAIWTSADSGATWMTNNVPEIVWSGVALSADGSRAVAIAQSGDVFTSTNFGTTWVSNSIDSQQQVAMAVASSADGNKLVVVSEGPEGRFGSPGGGIYTSQSTPSPSLSINRASDQLALSWIMPSTNFSLQQNSDLTTTNWVTLTNTPTLNLTNLQNEVTLTPSNSSGFYRLKTP